MENVEIMYQMLGFAQHFKDHQHETQIILYNQKDVCLLKNYLNRFPLPDPSDETSLCSIRVVWCDYLLHDLRKIHGWIIFDDFEQATTLGTFEETWFRGLINQMLLNSHIFEYPGIHLPQGGFQVISSHLMLLIKLENVLSILGETHNIFLTDEYIMRCLDINSLATAHHVNKCLYMNICFASLVQAAVISLQ